MDNEISPPSSHWYYWTEQQVRPEHQRTLPSSSSQFLGSSVQLDCSETPFPQT